MAVETDSKSDVEVRKEKKKEKKEKRKEEMDVDDSEPKKKKSKKRKHEEVTSTEDSEKKKKKKKKHDDEDEEKKKDKKSKKSKQDDSTQVSSYLSKNNITISDSSQPTIFPTFPHLSPHLPSSLQNFWISRNYKDPSPIQPLTLAFGVPALVKIVRDLESDDESKKKKKGKKGSTITTLILSPTRELALQTHDQLVSLGEPLGIGCVAVFGGVGKEQQVQLLQNQHHQHANGVVTRIVVGTPGRILDLINDGVCDLSGVNFLVLDEADRMLDKGFEQDIKRIIGFTRRGEERQTLMFSATWPEAVRKLASSFQKSPVRVTVGSDELTANSRIEQIVEVLEDGRRKENRLFHHLRALSHPKQPSTSQNGTSPPSRILIFALYKAEAARLSSTLIRAGYSTSSLHGDLSQQARLAALQEFKQGKTGLMVATDVAARGLDIPDVRVVINYTFPLGVEDYVHRIGRSAHITMAGLISTGQLVGRSVGWFVGWFIGWLAGRFAGLLQCACLPSKLQRRWYHGHRWSWEVGNDKANDDVIVSVALTYGPRVYGSADKLHFYCASSTVTNGPWRFFTFAFAFILIQFLRCAADCSTSIDGAFFFLSLVLGSISIGRGGKSGKSITFFTGENHERALAGELNRLLEESGFECKELKEKFPMTIKKKEHSAYGAFYREIKPSEAGKERKKIVFGDD
ncbi:hypothetical protein D9758_007353 [Tetrapyrgos nigripes]|uniref:RNA helicase n=1 Tax=Tetrapyrgos nigripes TaxID=182062 RepID=A0A8H5GB07_9AGAR|nr:hypothetical protein D9758_007353 [Tetrapyrgos nigripes]